MLYLDALLDLSLIQSSHSSKAFHSQMALCKQGIIGGSNKWKAASVKIIMFTQLAEVTCNHSQTNDMSYC